MLNIHYFNDNEIRRSLCRGLRLFQLPSFFASMAGLHTKTLFCRRVVSLLKKGANSNDLVNGSSALHIAAGLTVPAGYLFTQLLIDHGADVNLKSGLGQTAIQFAASFGRSETVRYETIQCSNVIKISSSWRKFLERGPKAFVLYGRERANR